MLAGAIKAKAGHGSQARLHPYLADSAAYYSTGAEGDIMALDGIELRQVIVEGCGNGIHHGGEGTSTRLRLPKTAVPFP